MTKWDKLGEAGEHKDHPLKVAFDVDGTLIYDSEGKGPCDTPRYDIIQLFKFFEEHGHDMYVWSGGGVDYAERWAERLGLNATIVKKGGPLMDIAVDDAETVFVERVGLVSVHTLATTVIKV